MIGYHPPVMATIPATDNQSGLAQMILRHRRMGLPQQANSQGLGALAYPQGGMGFADRFGLVRSY